MNFYILGKCVYYIFILASIIFPLQAFYKYFPRKDTSQKNLCIAYGCYAVFLFAMFFVSNYVVVSVISFIIFPIWTLNNILFLEGTRGFVLIRCIYFPSAFSMRRLAKKNTIISIAVVTIRQKSEPFLPMYKLIRFHFGKSKDITPTSIPVKDSDKRAKI